MKVLWAMGAINTDHGYTADLVSLLSGTLLASEILD